MTPNEFLADRITLLGVRLSQIELAVFRALDKRVNAAVSEFLNGMTVPLQDGQYLPTLLANSMGRVVDPIIRDLEETLTGITAKLSQAITTAITPKTQSEQLNVSIIDPFGISDLAPDNSFDIFAEMIGISEDEARELFAEMLLWGFTLRQLLTGWRAEMMLKSNNRLAGRLSELRGIGIDAGEVAGLQPNRVNQAIRETVQETIPNSLNGLKNIASAGLFGGFSRLVMRLVANNPAIFLQRFMWTAVLDGNTCRRCAAKHGTIVAAIDGQIRGQSIPLHTSCRCLYVPLVGLDLPKQSFDDWLRSQSDKVQSEILGVKGAKLYRDRKLSVNDFVQARRNGTIRIRTLPEIKKL